MVPMMSLSLHPFAFAGTLRVRNELQSANKQQEDWGFLSGKLTRSLSTSSAPAQYHNSGAWTIKRIMVPEKADGDALPQVRCNRWTVDVAVSHGHPGFHANCNAGPYRYLQIGEIAMQGSAQNREH